MDDNTIESTTGSGLVRVSEDPINWSQPPGFADYQDPLLHFGLNNTPPLLVQTENAPIIGVKAFIYFEDDIIFFIVFINSYWREMTCPFNN